MTLLVCLILPVLFTTVYSAASGRVEMKGPPPPGCECKCNGYTHRDMKGHIVGNCGNYSKSWGGAPYCFVGVNAPCMDGAVTKISPNLRVSQQACSAADDCYDDGRRQFFVAGDELPTDINASGEEIGDQDFDRVQQRDLIEDRRRWDSEEDPHNPSDCTCTCETFEVIIGGKYFGYCNEKADDGIKGAWCYVTSKANCTDMLKTSHVNNGDNKKQWFMSYQACYAPKRCYEKEKQSAADKLPRMLAHDQDLGRDDGGEDIAEPEELTHHSNKKHVAVDITMHFKNHMSPNGDVSTALGTEPFGP